MKKLFTLMAAVAAMVSCSDNVENVPTTPETDRLPINISTILTRATDSAFEAGDKVGIFVVNEPNALTTSGNHVDNMGFTYSTTWTRQPRQISTATILMQQLQIQRLTLLRQRQTSLLWQTTRHRSSCGVRPQALHLPRKL